MSKLKGDPGYRAGWCIHYQAPRGDDPCCEVGVPYSTVRGPGQPCFLDKGQPRPGASHCPKLRLPTADEIAAHEQWAKGRREQFTTVMVGILPWRQKNRGRSHSEVIECPACKGRLHLSISSYNGHVHGRCETDGCVAWME